FLSNMSHDIRTPMNAIMGFTALARKNLDNVEKAAEYLDMITASGEQLLQLLNDVLEISKIESAQLRVEEDECSLIELMQQIQKAVAFRAAAKNITLSLDITHLRHDIVSADREKLSEILSYLVDNALKYTKENGRVTIAVAEQEALKDHYIAYQFMVEDNGIGISGEFLEHIFDPFEREKNTTFSGIHGTGLGLTITKKLVDMMGGNIYVTSTVGVGSKFVVSVPLKLPDICQENPKEEIGLMKLTDSKNILLVDDNEINLEIEAEMLKDAGFFVETAENGKIALEKIAQSFPGTYDLILMDIQMPVMDGYQATRAIRQIPNPGLARIPIIAVSANAFEEDRRKAMECGMNAHLPKPLDMGQLFEVMGKFL
ncbi:MAG TPA: hybrid sensor histidine kinase/response regulator, partial [Lachnospiraceae bacterium]|nr:hybrid sensor histidine kinase/response regulator [Lachnospiraceae bacterium]